MIFVFIALLIVVFAVFLYSFMFISAVFDDLSIYFFKKPLYIHLYLNPKKISNELYYKRTKKLLMTTLLVSVFIALVTTLFSKYLITIIFGAKFYAALPVLYIYAWSSIGAALTSVTHQILLTENLTRYVVKVTFFGMITNVLLNIVLIPKYGMSGAAFATLISYFVPFLTLFLFTATREKMISILKN